MGRARDAITGRGRPKPGGHSRPFVVMTRAQAVVRRFPIGLLASLSQPLGAWVGPRLMPEKRAMLERHLKRVDQWRDPAPGSGRRSDEAASAGFGSYSRYWAESLSLPTASVEEIDRGFSFIGYEHLLDVQRSGRAPLLILPHLGGWEWAAAWIGRVAKAPITAVVERLEPDDVFDWFVELRSAYGVNVIPLGTGAGIALLRAAKQGDIICLLADRDIASTGSEVEFFGEITTLPSGPAMLSHRTGNPMVPGAVFFDRRKRICVIGKPIEPESRTVDDLMAEMARALEQLIASAPDQWHLLEPNWPSDTRVAR